MVVLYLQAVSVSLIISTKITKVSSGISMFNIIIIAKIKRKMTFLFRTFQSKAHYGKCEEKTVDLALSLLFNLV